MVIHFEFEVVECLHYHSVVGFQPLLNHFSVGLYRLNLLVDLFKYIQFLISIVDYGFQCIYF